MLVFETFRGTLLFFRYFSTGFLASSEGGSGAKSGFEVSGSVIKTVEKRAPRLAALLPEGSASY